jgi:murein DD-endopeptidase MepM/ murein hydrolase activator NlpD
MHRPVLIAAALAVILLLPITTSAYEVRTFREPVRDITLAPESVAPIGFQWGYVKVGAPEPCLTPEQRTRIRKQLEQSRAQLRAAGKLSAPDRSAAVTFRWPLEGMASMGFHDEGYHGISNFVDQDPTTGLLDYQCGQRTYDGHQGTDFFLWPFAWYKKNHRHVRVVAPADGVVLFKRGLQPDTSCVNDGFSSWNAVYLEHADGSVTWSGHLRKGGITLAAVGDTVHAGERLGWVGSSGSSTGPHLHLEVYDPDGNLVDPYAGSCNSLNANTWWTQQQPYYDSGINAVMTHSAAPVFPPCPQEEILNEQTEFPAVHPMVWTAAYYRDQLDTQTSTYTIRRPDGTVYTSWNHTPSGAPHYAAAEWLWVHDLGASPPIGVWTFEVTYLGQTYTQPFGVGTSAVDAPLAAASTVSLANRPNPVRRATDIVFRLPAAGRARLAIYDVGGRRVRTVLDAVRPSGPGAVTWDGRDEDGSTVPAGVYFYRLESGATARTQKMTVVR